jgi:hypothetical protein
MRRAHGLLRASALGLSLLLAAPAAALPITLYADARPGSGFDPADVAAALAAGAEAPVLVAGLSDGAGYFEITTLDGSPAAKGKSKRRPARVAGTWTLHVAPETPVDLLQDFCVVILGHDPHDPRRYKTRNVGLEIGTELSWRLVTPEPGGPIYLAYALGDLEPGRSYEIAVEYRVGQKLKKKRGVYHLPRFAVAYLSVPEPSALLLALAGGALALGTRRRRRARGPLRPS